MKKLVFLATTLLMFLAITVNAQQGARVNE